MQTLLPDGCSEKIGRFQRISEALLRLNALVKIHTGDKWSW